MRNTLSKKTGDSVLLKVEFGLIFFFVTAFAPRTMAAVCGSLAAVKEKVEVLRLQSSGAGGRGSGEAVRYAMTGKNFMTLECDDVVQTGPTGGAKLILGDDKISIAPDSRLEIAAYSGTAAKPKVDLLNLTYGKMRGLIKTRKDAAKSPQGAFRVRTFSAVVGVRGTDLFASYDPNVGLTEQAVIEGRVEVTQAGTNQKVIVEAGQQVSVETTPQAIETAKKRVAGRQEADILAPSTVGGGGEGVVGTTVKPLQVVSIKESVKKDMRMASAIAKEDADFSSTPAVTVLGSPRTWTIEREDVPANLKKIENEF